LETASEGPRPRGGGAQVGKLRGTLKGEEGGPKSAKNSASDIRTPGPGRKSRIRVF